VDPRAGLDDVKITYPTATRTPTSSVVQPVAIPYTVYAIPAATFVISIGNCVTFNLYTHYSWHFINI
jgi:hypothetical protein